MTTNIWLLNVEGDTFRQKNPDHPSQTNLDQEMRTENIFGPEPAWQHSKETVANMGHSRTT